MHLHGINMRYLGHILVATDFSFIKSICTIDILARQLKHILKSQISQTIMDNKEQANQLLSMKKQKLQQIKSLQSQIHLHNVDHEELKSEIAMLKKEELVITENIKKRLTVDIQRKIKKLIVDLYNLIFGKDQET